MLGNCLKKARQKNALSQEEVCTNICSVRQLSRIENNQSLPSLELFILLVNELDVDTFEVMQTLTNQLIGKKTNMSIYACKKPSYSKVEDS
ncbi:MAG: helix-turn-helix domain-containing protein [Brochothrix thermosphacta]|uniref:helix-turn-helix domain-containing protein n=1 Tax=Brochothrix thermosphacta TaxID=2756 RepID=UPI003F92EEA0